MKEELIALTEKLNNPSEKLNIAREYLQAFTLRSLHESEAFQSLSFVGGTALRFLYQLPRFSEDLDFSLIDSQNYTPEKWMKKLKRDLEFSNFNGSVLWKDKNIVHTGWVKVDGLLKEMGLSPMASQKLSIKIDVDTDPPKEAILENIAINKYFLMAMQCYNLSSLMAGKIHALCCRQYTKGRDWYDFMWYRARIPKVEPNLNLLQNALNQTLDKPWPAKNWQKKLKDSLDRFDEKLIIKDVLPFLERPEEAKLLTKENFKNLIS